MKIIAGVMVGAGLVLASWALFRLSSDAVAMMLGMALGVVACLPAWALILIARNGGGAAGRDEPEARFHGLQGGDHIRLTGSGLDGTWRRQPEERQERTDIVIVRVQKCHHQ